MMVFEALHHCPQSSRLWLLLLSLPSHTRRTGLPAIFLTARQAVLLGLCTSYSLCLGCPRPHYPDFSPPQNFCSGILFLGSKLFLFVLPLTTPDHSCSLFFILFFSFFHFLKFFFSIYYFSQRITLYLFSLPCIVLSSHSNVNFMRVEYLSVLFTNTLQVLQTLLRTQYLVTQ